jgi:arylsulfatase A-like enzyme
MTGKWHVDGLSPKACFQKFGKVRPGMPQTTKDVYKRPKATGQETWTPWDESLKGYWEGGKHWSVVTADDAIAYLDSRRGKTQPFFAYVAFNAPHDPRQAPKSFVDMYPAAKVDLPRNFLPLAPFYDKIGCGKDLRDEALCTFPRSPEAIRQHRGEYYALISHFDQQVGRILDQLEASGQDKNTLVIFTADHGLACGHHGLMGKQNMYEHSLRTAFILRGPGIPAGRQVTTPIYLQDAFPTSLEAAGIAVPSFVEFKSVLPLLGTQPPPHYASIYGCYSSDLQRCVIDQGWKLIHYPKLGTSMLFDLAQDPDEMHDLASDPLQTSRLAELRQKLVELEKELEDPLQVKSAKPLREPKSE